jgi:hypothetical protein
MYLRLAHARHFILFSSSVVACNVIDVPDGLLAVCPTIQSLNLAGNRIAHLPPGLVSANSSLRSLFVRRRDSVVLTLKVRVQQPACVHSFREPDALQRRVPVGLIFASTIWLNITGAR